MKILALLLISVIIYLAYDLYYGRNGVEQYSLTEEKVQVASEKTQRLERRNQALSDEISDLKKGKLVVEELARSDLGMIKQNEQFYRVIEKDETQKPKKK